MAGNKSAASVAVTLKTAVRQREIWQREIEESKYIKPKPRTDLILFSDICDSASEYYKNYTRAWDAAEGRIARLKEWWPGRTAESITTPEIERNAPAMNTASRCFASSLWRSTLE